MSTYWKKIGICNTYCTIGGDTGVHRGTVPPLEREILTMTLGVAWK